MAMVFTIYIIVLVSFASFKATVAADEEFAPAPAPMESKAAALGVPAALGVIVSLLAWFF